MSKVLILSSDCHAGALPSTYNEYMPSQYHAAAKEWWLEYVKEMMARTGTFFDQEAVDEMEEKTGEAGQFQAISSQSPDTINDEKLFLHRVRSRGPPVE